MGAFFSCMPVAASMSRSMVQYDAGGVSQIASLISSTLMLIVVMWIAPIFQYLPMVNAFQLLTFYTEFIH